MMKLILILFPLCTWATCQLDSKFEYISLSAPVTSFFEQLQILNDTSLKVISHFHPTKGFGGERWQGGIYLPVKKIRSIQAPTVLFFDQSQELRNLLNQEQVSEKIQAVEIATAQKPLATIFSELKEQLIPYLKNCSWQIKKLENQLAQAEVLYQQVEEKKDKVLFFLGEIKENQYPNKLVNNDLFVSELRKRNLFTAYPADSAYVDWSAKILGQFEAKWFVGLSDRCSKAEFKTEGQKLNFCHPRVFIPGIDQVEVMEKFLSQWQKVIH